MYKMFVFNKYIYMYIYIFICLFNHAINNDLTVTSGDKTWKFILNNTTNANIFYNKLESLKSIQLELESEISEDDGHRSFKYMGSEFSFVIPNSPISTAKKYSILAGNNQYFNFIYILLDEVGTSNYISVRWRNNWRNR